MRNLLCVVAGLILCASPVHAAAAPDPSCKKIHDAVWAGKTLEQITAEFDTDAATVMKCTQKKGKRKKAPKSKTKSSTSTKSSKSQSSSGTTSTENTKSQAPPTRKPSLPRSGGRAPYQP